MSERTLVGSNWSTTTVPAFIAAPDADNNGKPDLWATTPGTGRIRTFHDLADIATTPSRVTVASEVLTGYRAIG